MSRYVETRHIENFMLGYPAFLARLNALSSHVSVSSEASMLSQASQPSQDSQILTDHTANFESSPEYLKQQREIKTWLTTNIEVIMKTYPPMTSRTPTSVPGRTEVEHSIYVGCGGNAYLHWKLTRFFEAEEEKEKAEVHKKNAISAIEVALTMLPSKFARGDEISFYMGSAGIYCLAAVIYWMAGHLSKTEEHLYKLLSLLPSCLDDKAVDEVLYGRAGYLFCLLFVKKHTSRQVVERFRLETAARQVFDAIVAHGKQNSGVKPPNTGILTYSFYGTNYFGAAHGIAGILYVLLQFPDWCRDPSNKPWFSATIDSIISVQSPSGNFPPSADQVKALHLHHWCHGAPGMVYTLYHAHKVLMEDKSILRSLDLALKETWEKGLLKKGFGICHGIAGSGYAFLNMYRYTGADEHLYAAFKMAEAISSGEIKKHVEVYMDNQRKTVGIPDFPYSLMEGLGGTICYYCDLLHPNLAAFPGYDGDI